MHRKCLPTLVLNMLVQEQRSDVYAYAIVMWEIIACFKPWDGCTVDDIELQVRQGKRPSPIPKSNDERIRFIIELFQLCWKQEVNDRPRAIDIVQKLELL